MAARRSRRLLAALLLAALALALPRCAAAPAAKSSSRAHRKAHKESVRAKKHAADRRDRLSAGATVGTGDAALLDATAGMCNFMETEAFEEFFSGEANDTRWDLGSMDGLFHCSRGTDEYCTMASKANFAWGAPLPFYPGENVTGAYLTLTQSPCNNPWRKGLCCGYPRESEGKAARAAHAPICSNWTGAHLISRGCILYGTLTMEMAMRMPRGTMAFWDIGTYVRGGKPDPTWNELDMIFRTELVNASGVNGTVGVNGSYVSYTFDATFFNPIEHKQVFSPSSYPRFTGYMARAYHNYTVTWTPHYILWSLDAVPFFNQTRHNGFHRRIPLGLGRLLGGTTLIPWRPMTIRLILHTADGSAVPQQAAHVSIRRLAYEPLPYDASEDMHSAGVFLRRALLAAAVLYGGYLLLLNFDEDGNVLNLLGLRGLRVGPSNGRVRRGAIEGADVAELERELFGAGKRPLGGFGNDSERDDDENTPLLRGGRGGGRGGRGGRGRGPPRGGTYDPVTSGTETESGFDSERLRDETTDFSESDAPAPPPPAAKRGWGWGRSSPPQQSPPTSDGEPAQPAPAAGGGRWWLPKRLAGLGRREEPQAEAARPSLAGLPRGRSPPQQPPPQPPQRRGSSDDDSRSGSESEDSRAGRPMRPMMRAAAPVARGSGSPPNCAGSGSPPARTGSGSPPAAGKGWWPQRRGSPPAADAPRRRAPGEPPGFSDSDSDSGGESRRRTGGLAAHRPGSGSGHYAAAGMRGIAGVAGRPAQRSAAAGPPARRGAPARSPARRDGQQ